MLLLDPDTGRSSTRTRRAAAFYGWTQERLREMRVQEINTLPPGKVLEEIGKVRREVSGSISSSGTGGATARSGTSKCSAARSRAQERKNPAPIIHDITERKKAEDALESQPRGSYRQLSPRQFHGPARTRSPTASCCSGQEPRDTCGGRTGPPPRPSAKQRIGSRDAPPMKRGIVAKSRATPCPVSRTFGSGRPIAEILKARRPDVGRPHRPAVHARGTGRKRHRAEARHHRARAPGGAVPPCPEDGIHRDPGGGGGPRLQQHPDGHHRVRAHRAHGHGGRRPAAAQRREHARGRRAGGAPHQGAPPVQPAATRRAQGRGPERRRAQGGEIPAARDRGGHRVPPGLRRRRRRGRPGRPRGSVGRGAPYDPRRPPPARAGADEPRDERTGRHAPGRNSFPEDLAGRPDGGLHRRPRLRETGRLRDAVRLGHGRGDGRRRRSSGSSNRSSRRRTSARAPGSGWPSRTASSSSTRGSSTPTASPVTAPRSASTSRSGKRRRRTPTGSRLGKRPGEARKRSSSRRTTAP